MPIDWQATQETFLRCLLEQDTDQAIRIASETLARGVTPADFFVSCITPALVEIGDRFERLDIFLPEMVAAAEIVEQVNAQVVQPRIASSTEGQTVSMGKVLLATIQGDRHDIGKNMVAVMLRVSGFEVVDLGVDVSPADIVAGAQREGTDIIGMSSLLTSCLPYMKDVVDSLRRKDLREKYSVIIGGAAPTAAFAEQAGVDAQGHSAPEAVRICKAIMAAKMSERMEGPR
jgi:methylmalonyl-CoA mutase cobalamin-binding domain/chain